MRKEERGNNAVGSFMAIGTICPLLCCMLISGAMLSLPLLGGAVYLAAEGILRIAALARPAKATELSKALKWAAATLTAVIAGWALALLAASSDQLKSSALWPAAGAALCAAIRTAATNWTAERLPQDEKKKALALFGIQTLFCCLAAPLFWARADRWTLLGCWAVSGIPACFPIHRESCDVSAFTDQDRADRDALRGAHAFVMYRRLALAVSAAVQAVTVLGCACLALAVGAPLACMALALLCAVVVPLAVVAALNRPRQRETDPNKVHAVGLLAWLAGLISFACFRETPAGSAVSLALCFAGAAANASALAGLRADMRRAAAFALGHAPGKMDDSLIIDLRFSALAGLTVSLACLAVMNLFPVLRLSPLLLSALALALAALVYALGFPLRQLHLFKLRRYTLLREQGVENIPLRDQLEPVVIQKSVKNYGIRLVECVLRPFFFHRVQGAENVQLDEDIPCVFVCNHGEILGPVVCTLFSPFPFRAWSAYEMLDRNAVIDRTMNGTFQNIKGPARSLLHGVMAHIGAPFLTWLLTSEGCIAVYHDNPRRLMQTFRETIAAMQAEDNILVFPENAATSSDGRYVEEGVSEFFTGFTMIGQMYASKTGKCPLFVPMYANKKKRLITYGIPTRYDDQAPVNEEKERLCAYLRGEIMRLAGLEDKQK